MTKRAAIYVRVSSERQAAEDRVSIDVQMRECEELCERRGYFIVARYVDQEKYRSRGQLVQPSGTRKDRPGYQAILKATAAGEVDVIVAWKEDRLYRGLRAAMPLSDLLDDMGTALEVELVKETFDRKMLGIKAALGKVEVDNIRERMIMGRRARLERGEVPGGDQIKYGYRKVNKALQIDEAEAETVRLVFDWYNAGDNHMTIRKRLVARGIQPRSSRYWNKSVIGRIIASECYASGNLETTLDGETFQIPCPPIISQETWQRSVEIREGNRTTARNVKYDYLLSGLVYCACGWKCQTRASVSNRNRGYSKVSGLYACQRQYTMPEIRPADCITAAGCQRVDNYVWQLVRRVCDNPALLRDVVAAKLAANTTEKDELLSELGRLDDAINAVTGERQWVITQARKGQISENDMVAQLGELQVQEWSLRREWSDQMAGLSALQEAQSMAGWVETFLRDVSSGLDALETDVDRIQPAAFDALYVELEAWRYAERFPEDQEAQLRWAIIEEKRRVIRLLVKKVILSKGKGRNYDITPILHVEIPISQAVFLGYSDQSLAYIERRESHYLKTITADT